MKIVTDHKWKNFLYRYEIPEHILTDQFSHLDTDTGDGFLRYKGCYYHTSDFMCVDNNNVDTVMQDWDGYTCDSAFTGILIKVSDDGEQYKIGTYYCGS